ncbi:hypothetical protein [Micromonospora nigra]|uniref:hypothetical protein n=1 Tax=Micromonospora nigra TaxID=145857 RepID=UPI000B834AD1|nr:hypothetical protein [Micromonospora nigra]
MTDQPSEAPTAARIALTGRYVPTVCAYPGCGLPPHTTWIVREPGELYGTLRSKGDVIDLCGSHEHDTGQPVHTPRPPRQRRRRPEEDE